MKMRSSPPKGCVYVAVTLVVTALLYSSPSGIAQATPEVTIISPSKQSPVQTNLVSDVPGLAITTDPNLINPWGIANSATSPYWISDQGTDKSTLYTGAGTANATVVTIPPIGSSSGPTGIIDVPAGTTGFAVPGTTTTAHFIFSTLDGTIAAWASGTTAVTAATISGASFTGLAFANNGTANYLYAANFVNGGTIEVFDLNFNPATLAASFTDPTLPANYAPFNIQLLGSDLYVTYAQISAQGGVVGGAGLGYVDVFDANGNFLQRLISNGSLNAPWGITLAPAGFTSFPGDLLVGNFGNGQINAFNSTTGSYVGTISDPEGKPIVNQGLWALEFGNGNAGSSPTTLYFNAGINGEQDGLFGAITPGPVSLTFASQLVGTTSAAQTLTVENTGGATLDLTAAPSLTPANTTQFAIVASGTTCTSGATLAPGGSCVIKVTFTPSAAGASTPVTLTLTDNASSAAQIVSLAGTGATGTPTVTISPATSPLTFAGQLVTSASASQTVTVTNTGTGALTFGAQAIGITGDFAQTNTCNGATVAVNATCTIAVTFTPASTENDPRAGLLTITDSAANSPQTLALSGTGWDFTVTAPPNETLATPGSSGTLTATVGALGGFTGSVALTCSTTIPVGSCTLSTSSVTAPGSATVTFTTNAHLQPPATRDTPKMTMRQVVPLLLALTLLICLPALRRLRIQLLLVGVMLIIITMAGCGSNAANPATPTGTYSLLVTGTSGGVSRSATVIVAVN